MIAVDLYELYKLLILSNLPHWSRYVLGSCSWLPDNHVPDMVEQLQKKHISSFCAIVADLRKPSLFGTGAYIQENLTAQFYQKSYSFYG